MFRIDHEVEMDEYTAMRKKRGIVKLFVLGFFIDSLSSTTQRRANNPVIVLIGNGMWICALAEDDAVERPRLLDHLHIAR